MRAKPIFRKWVHTTRKSADGMKTMTLRRCVSRSTWNTCLHSKHSRFRTIKFQTSLFPSISRKWDWHLEWSHIFEVESEEGLMSSCLIEILLVNFAFLIFWEWKEWGHLDLVILVNSRLSLPLSPECPKWGHNLLWLFSSVGSVAVRSKSRKHIALKNRRHAPIRIARTDPSGDLSLRNQSSLTGRNWESRKIPLRSQLALCHGHLMQLWTITCVIVWSQETESSLMEHWFHSLTH